MKTKLIFWLKIVSCIQNALQYVFVYFNMDELMKIYIYRKKSVLIHTTSLPKRRMVWQLTMDVLWIFIAVINNCYNKMWGKFIFDIKKMCLQKFLNCTNSINVCKLITSVLIILYYAGLVYYQLHSNNDTYTQVP